MSEADGNSGELRDIAYHIECLVAAVERIEKLLVQRGSGELTTTLEEFAPQGDERERIALSLFINQDELWPERCYELADRWMEERDKQRAKQAEANAQPTI